MKLYTYDAAPNPRRLGLFLQYKGIEIETEQVDLLEQEQHGEAFAALNPLRTVPALLLDDGTLLTEVIAQAHYLESLHPEKPLLGRTAQERALVLQWDHIAMLHGGASIQSMFRNRSKGFQGRALPGAAAVKQIPELVPRGKALLDQFWQLAEQRLQQAPWLAGESFSFADITLFCLAEFAGWVKESIPQSCPRLQNWHHKAANLLPAKAA